MTLKFKRAVFGLFRDLLGRILWDIILKIRDIQDTWLIFIDCLVEANLTQCARVKKSWQEACTDKKGAPEKTRRRKKEENKMCKQEQVLQEEFRDAV